MTSIAPIVCLKFMNTADLIKEVDEVFPPVPKPHGVDLSFHKVGCDECRYVRQDLEGIDGSELPFETLRYLRGELSCLSAKGWRWVLPSYLKHCLTVDSTYDDLETEFLIYNLGPELKYQKETLERLSLLNKSQIECLVHFLQWCEVHPHWSGYCREDIARALAFMRTVRA